MNKKTNQKFLGYGNNRKYTEKTIVGNGTPYVCIFTQAANDKG